MRHPFFRVTLAILVAMLVVFTGTAAALAATVAVTGFAHVEVDDPESGSISVPVPALAVDAALAVASVAIPAEEKARMRRDIEPYRPLLAALANELERCPDATLVEVESPRESVRIEKRGRNLVVDVDDRAGDTRVHVTLPMRTMKRALALVAG